MAEKVFRGVTLNATSSMLVPLTGFSTRIRGRSSSEAGKGSASIRFPRTWKAARARCFEKLLTARVGQKVQFDPPAGFRITSIAGKISLKNETTVQPTDGYLALFPAARARRAFVHSLHESGH